MRNSLRAFAIIGCLLMPGSVFGTEQTLTVNFVGDIMLGRQVGKTALEVADPCLPFRAIAGQLHKADLTIGNLECVFMDSNITGTDLKDKVLLPAFARMAQGLTFGSIQAVSLANNHSLDYGPEGLGKTLLALERQKVRPIGLEETDPVRIFEKGVTISLFGLYCRQGRLCRVTKQGGYAWAEPAWLAQSLMGERQKADLVVVYVHWFDSVQTYPSDMQKTYSRRFVDAGADLVVGQGTHIVQSAERYGTGIIVYSLGNFIFDQKYAETQKGTILTVRITKGKRLAYAAITPTRVSSEMHYRVIQDGKPKTF